ncbi:cytoplasmic protein, partial [Candidatus Bathyarchaeota archaeon]
MPDYLAFHEFPKTVKELKNFDVVVLSDIGSNSLVLYPELFKVPMGPNRLVTIRDYVRDGGGLVMAGGWYSFAGALGIARYYGTPVEEALPVKISTVDDRVEAPEGVTPRILKPEHEIFKGIPDKWPTFLGYNKVKLKDGADL